MGNTPLSTAPPRLAPVHPHACGEYDFDKLFFGGFLGSPPRVWGIQCSGRSRARRSRFTPTRVGNTGVDDSRQEIGAVHPHACGEYTIHVRPRLSVRGSPPRVWGILEMSISSERCIRFTPTRVGNTAPPTLFAATPAVHPHACGEYALLYAPTRALGGSPPRVWGIRFQFLVRLIRSSVHPHACGEYAVWRVNGKTPHGSPPRVWGIRDLEAGGFISIRFTPTRVGNTCAHCARPLRLAVHPHACGEYLVAGGSGIARRGSPPRVWGILLAVRTDAQHRRFTPTRVGNTGVPTAPPLATPVHPHACGEYRQPFTLVARNLGSPPRVWGIPARTASEPKIVRFTPTRVGNTTKQIKREYRAAVHPHACGEYVTP